MNEHEAPFWEGVDEDSFVMPSEEAMARTAEQAEVARFVASHVTTREHLAVIDGHVPMDTDILGDSEYLDLSENTINRIIRRHRRAMKSNLH